jgi:hypothetical protein
MVALIEPGDTILGLDLAHGGHLTHGMRINFSGKLYRVAAYQVARDDHRIDMEQVRRLAHEHRPRLIVAGWSAYPRQLDFAAFREIADEVGAYLMVDMAAPQPRPARPRRHHDHAQDARRPPRRRHPLHRRHRQEDQQCRVPRPAGWTAGARRGREGGGLQGRRG